MSICNICEEVELINKQNSKRSADLFAEIDKITRKHDEYEQNGITVKKKGNNLLPIEDRYLSTYRKRDFDSRQ